jgi:hypothetical protein
LAYQPPASSTFLSQQTSHQQPASSTLLSEQISTSHQPPANRTGNSFEFFFGSGVHFSKIVKKYRKCLCFVVGLKSNYYVEKVYYKTSNY